MKEAIEDLQYAIGSWKLEIERQSESIRRYNGTISDAQKRKEDAEKQIDNCDRHIEVLALAIDVLEEYDERVR